MTNRFPIYDVTIDEDESLGLFGISYVDAPAIMEQLVSFKDEVQRVFLVSAEKHEIVSPVLIPNQLIFRQYDGMPCYIRFSEETIRKAAERYLLKGYFNNWTLMHADMDKDIKDRVQPNIFTKRLWIIEDEKTDDANTIYGYNLPKGTLMIHAKVNNREIWKMIKDGTIRGLSMEAYLSLKSTNKQLEIEFRDMAKFDFDEKRMNLFQRFVAFLNEVSQEADDIADEAKKDETNSGEIELKYYLDDEHYFVVDGDGFVKDENGNDIAEGEYKLADGNVFVVGTDGKFVETRALTEQAGDEEVEAPIAEGFKEEEDKVEEEEEKEDETKDDTNDGEADNEAKPAEGETADEADEAADTDSDKENGETANEDEPVEKDEDDDEKKPMVNAFPFEIDGVEYLLPEEVINYIQNLQTSKVEVEEKLTNLSNQTPSAQPVGAVVKNGTPSKDDVINDRFEALERFKQWRKQRG